MDLLIRNEFSVFNPRELTSFLRGDLFIQVDCLMSFTYTNPSKDIPRVCAYFNMVLDIIIKWLQVVPSKVDSLNLKDPDAYLYERPTSIYKSGYEMLETLISILGLNPRTAKFYEKYKALTNTKQLIQNFMNKQGMVYVKNIIESNLPLEDFWNFLVVLPQLFAVGGSAASRYIPDYLEALVNSLDNISDEGMMEISNNYQKLEQFIDNSNNMMKLILPDNQREVYLNLFRGKFRMDRQSFMMKRASESLLEPSKDASPEISIPPIDIHEPKSFPTPKESSRPKLPVPPKSPQRPPVYSAPSIPQSPHPSSSQISTPALLEIQLSLSNLKSYVESKHQECVDLIEKSLKTGIDRKQENDYKLEEVFKAHNSCDHQEFAVLSAMEFLLTENKVQDALKLLRWRKKILKLANMNGWEIAEDVAKRTLQKLEVTSNDVIDANLRSVLSSRNSLDSQ
mmetsp:Transcript_18615/g.18592  ORF Transcript_18615/g.18592 Transcript_18615/m.18592 type:complete len:453 (-) Transcript_18615:29-1387(-)